jgi:hypothetical protein
MTIAGRVLSALLLIGVTSTIRTPALSVAVQSRAAQPSVSRETPSWVTRPPADGKDYSFVGTATSASESQARGSAYDEAVRQAVVRIGTRLFQDPSVATWYGIDALRDYVRKVGRNASQYVRPSSSGGYTAYVLLQVNRGFVEPSAVRQYAASPTSAQGQSAGAVGYLLVPSDAGPTAVTKRTQVRMPNVRQGNFYLYFSIAGTKGSRGGDVWIRLDQIQVLDDGSAGTTRWSFDVFVNNRKTFTTGIAAYSDDVVTYRMRAGDRNVETRAPAAGGLIEIRIVGTKISAAKAR